MTTFSRKMAWGEDSKPPPELGIEEIRRETRMPPSTETRTPRRK